MPTIRELIEENRKREKEERSPVSEIPTPTPQRVSREDQRKIEREIRLRRAAEEFERQTNAFFSAEQAEPGTIGERIQQRDPTGKLGALQISETPLHGPEIKPVGPGTIPGRIASGILETDDMLAEIVRQQTERNLGLRSEEDTARSFEELTTSFENRGTVDQIATGLASPTNIIPLGPAAKGARAGGRAASRAARRAASGLVPDVGEAASAIGRGTGTAIPDPFEQGQRIRSVTQQAARAGQQDINRLRQAQSTQSPRQALNTQAEINIRMADMRDIAQRISREQGGQVQQVAPGITRRVDTTTLDTSEDRAIIDWVGKYIADPDSIDAENRTNQMRAIERGYRATEADDIIAQAREQGISVEDAYGMSTAALRGQLPTVRADFGFDTATAERVREAIFNRFEEVVTEDGISYYERLNTRNALRRMLAGDPIFSRPGTIGGSMYARLERVLGPVVIKELGKGRTLEGIVRNPRLTTPRVPRGDPFAGMPSEGNQQMLFGRNVPAEQMPLGFADDLSLTGQHALETRTPRLDSFLNRPREFRPAQSEKDRLLELLEFRAKMEGRTPTVEEYAKIDEMVALQRGPRPNPAQGDPFATVADAVSQPHLMATDLLQDEYKVANNIGANETIADFAEFQKFVESSTEARRDIPNLSPADHGNIDRWIRNAGLTIMDAGNLMRATRASVDFSWWRQVVMLIPGNFKEFLNANGSAFRAMWNEDYAKSVMKSIEDDEYYGVYKDLGMDFLRPLDQKELASWQRVEDFMIVGGDRPLQKAAAKMPWLAISGRAHVTGINVMAWNIFRRHMQNIEALSRSGVRSAENPTGRLVRRQADNRFQRNVVNLFGPITVGPEDIVQRGGNVFGDQVTDTFARKEARAVARMLEDMTGRAKLPESLKQLSGPMNAGFFSMRLNLGRIFTPRNLFSNSQYTRREAWKNVLSGTSAIATTLLMGEYLGLWEIEKDMRSSDAWKIRVGRTRVDPWGGYQQFAVFATRMGSMIRDEQTKAIGTGQLNETDPGTITWNLFRSKLSPMVGDLITGITGTDFKGSDIDRNNWRYWLRQNLPLSVQDVLEAMESEGFDLGTGTALAPISFLGFSAPTYEVTENDILREMGYSELNYADLPARHPLRSMVRTRLEARLNQAKTNLDQIQEDNPTLAPFIVNMEESPKQRQERLRIEGIEREQERQRKTREGIQRSIPNRQNQAPTQRQTIRDLIDQNAAR